MKKYPLFILLLWSAIVSCKKYRPYDAEPEQETYIEASPFDIQYDKDRGWLYFFESTGEITIYDVAGNKVKEKIATESTIGYCDFGVYNGVKELYVPRNDGWVFIYNATTLKLIDQISIGLASSCVVQNNGILFVSTDAWTQSPLKSYNRSTKQFVAENGDHELTRLKKLPDTYTQLLEISIHVGPTDQDFYTFDGAGTFVSRRDDAYHGDYDLDAGIFEIFPAGNKYITSTVGNIFTKDMKFEASLPRGNMWYTTFAFDDSARFIYAGTHQKSIVVYDANTYLKKRSLTTKAYPLRVFYNKGELLCVSSYDPISSGWGGSSTPTNLLIEHLK